MPSRIHDIADEIVRLQTELDREIFKRRKALGWRLHDGLVEFEHGVVMENRRLKLSAAAFMARAPIATVLTAPVIYSLIVPLALIDLWASAYQAVCFRAYRLPQVERRTYLVFDRRTLAYLNWIEGLNCWFCEYANGVAAYGGRSRAGQNNTGARSNTPSRSHSPTNAISPSSNTGMQAVTKAGSTGSERRCVPKPATARRHLRRTPPLRFHRSNLHSLSRTRK